MHTRLSTLLLACTLFMLSAHGFKDHPQDLRDGDHPPHHQLPVLNINLDDLTEEQQGVFVHVLATGELPDDSDISDTPENFQNLIQLLLQNPDNEGIRLNLAQAQPELAMAVYTLRDTIAMSRCTLHAFTGATTQLPPFFTQLFANCAEIHGPFTVANEGLYQTWFADTLRTWLTEQYQERNILAANMQATYLPEEEGDDDAMDNGEDMPDQEVVGAPLSPLEEGEDGEDGADGAATVYLSIDFEEVDPVAKAQAHLDTWSSPDAAPDSLPPVVEATLQLLSEDASAPFRLFATKALYDVFQLMLTIAYGPHYLNFLRDNTLPPKPDAAEEADTP